MRSAAVACGVDESRIGTHSLRVTCATWLYQAGYDLEYIKRHGRWVSNVVHVYLWEGSGFHDIKCGLRTCSTCYGMRKPKNSCICCIRGLINLGEHIKCSLIHTPRKASLAAMPSCDDLFIVIV